jgi:tetratricopeptide (TPR) repeat protein
MNDVALNPQRVLHARYILQERLGAGGQGEVWRARDVQRDVDVALKILHPAASQLAAARAALEREHAINSALDHPHILKVFPPEDTKQGLLLPMELATGGDLRQLVGAGYLAIVPVLMEVAAALGHAHERGVVHRDLKPGNVLLDGNGGARLADFGIAGRAATGATERTRGHSPFSASPQQLRGEPPTAADDVYGLGALAFELLSGRPPYHPHFDPDKVQNGPVPELVSKEQMPAQLGALVRRMLQKDPKERPANMAEVRDTLDTVLNDTLSFEFETAEPPRGAGPLERTGRHPKVVRLAAANLPPEPPTDPGDQPTPGAADGPPLWEDLRVTAAPALPSRLEPMDSGRSRFAWSAAVVVVAACAAFFYLRHPGWVQRVLAQQGESAAPAAAPAAPAPTAAPADDAALRAERAQFDKRFKALEAHGAASWDGADLATAQERAAESTGALDAGSPALARTRLTAATQLLDAVERAAPAAVPAAAATTAAARSARDDEYARAAGEGFAALGAGRLDEARAAFEHARSLKPGAPEALDGLKRVSAAQDSATAGDVATLKSRAEQLEAQERWDEATGAYGALLRAQPELAFAQTGRTRAAGRARLDHSLQSLLDRPDQLSDPEARAQAAALLANAQATAPAGPVLRSQIARLQILLPEYDKPVPVSLVSDSVTQVAILSVGTFGSFERRDIQLKPGTYTVVGSRVGYRDVRREITVTPGEQQTVSVSCYDPI